MKKKLLSALLSVAMVSALLAGCGNKTEAPAAEAPAAEATEETAEAPAAEEAVEEAVTVAEDTGKVLNTAGTRSSRADLQITIPDTPR